MNKINWTYVCSLFELEKQKDPRLTVAAFITWVNLQPDTQSFGFSKVRRTSFMNVFKEYRKAKEKANILNDKTAFLTLVKYDTSTVIKKDSLKEKIYNMNVDYVLKGCKYRDKLFIEAFEESLEIITFLKNLIRGFSSEVSEQFKKLRANEKANAEELNMIITNARNLASFQSSVMSMEGSLRAEDKQALDRVFKDQLSIPRIDPASLKKKLKERFKDVQ